MTIRVGDLVTTRDGTRFYHVRSVNARTYSLEPIGGSSRRRHATNAAYVRLVRTAELLRFRRFADHARSYATVRADVVSANTMLVQARAWLDKARVRGDDDLGELAAALVTLKKTTQEVGA